MIFSSFKPDVETYAPPPQLLPQQWTLENYNNLWDQTDFLTYFRNSFVTATITTAIVLPVAAGAAYALGRLMPAARTLGGVTEHTALLAYMLPSILLVVPLARIVTGLGLQDSLVGLSLVYVAHLLPFGIWLLRSYFLGVPIDLESAAMVDGATRFQALYMVVLPQVVPGLIAVAIFTYNSAWGEYLFASVLLHSGDNLTLSAGVGLLVGQTAIFSWGMLMAAAVVVALPVLVFAIVLQRYLVAGWGAGGIKG